MRIRKYCVAFGCLNKSNDRSLTFHRLPKEVERQRIWLTALDREDLLKKENFKHTTHVVCSAHFDESDVGLVIRHLTKDAVPKLRLTNKTQDDSPSQASTSVQNKDDPKTFPNESANDDTSCSEPPLSPTAPINSTSVKIKDEPTTFFNESANTGTFEDSCCLCKRKIAKTYNVETQTEEQTTPIQKEQTHTSKGLTKDAPRKRKRVDDVKESKRKRR
ncbi:THAP domain-containing protein [Phthorimaea operculella]|nr:THAP domain-containing protein [Phthorimaea operculella]